MDESVTQRKTVKQGAYQYQSLDTSRKEIRLLRIKAGRQHTAVHCTLDHISLQDDSPVEYEALSYCWGDPTMRAQVHLDGHVVSVPKSSEEALRGLRLPNKDRTLWIDAVCINQSDNDERGDQVALMGDIYRNATGTAIWLGDADDTTELAVEAIGILLQQMRHESRRHGSLKAFLFEGGDVMRKSITEVPSSCDTDALQTFFSKSWFQRLWVVQEAVLGRQAICYCGSLQIDWTHVAQAAVWLLHKSYHPRTPLFTEPGSGTMRAAKIWSYSDRENGYWGSQTDSYPPMSVLLKDFSDCQASEPRDKIYGILGLKARDSLPMTLIPNYHDSRTVRDLYRDATRFAMVERQSLSMLRLVQDMESTPDSPSWVPCFDRPLYGPSCLVNFFFDAAVGRGVNVSSLKDTKDPDILTARGVVVDTVQHSFPILAGPAMKNPNILLQELRRVRHLQLISDRLWQIGLGQGSASYRTGETYARALGLTLVVGGNWDDCNATKDLAHDANFSAFVHLAAKHNSSQAVHRLNSLTKMNPAGSTEQAHRYYDQLLHVSENRNFLRTESGLLGNGSKLVEKDDVICVLFGLDVPVVLRKVGRRYRFVGTCYVHGIMTGEAIEMLHSGELEARTIELM